MECNTIMDRIHHLENEIELLKNEVDRLNFIIENMQVDNKATNLSMPLLDIKFCESKYDNDQYCNSPDECLMCGS